MRWRFCHAHPATVLADPKLEVLESVVKLIAVAVMNRLVALKLTPENLLHHQAMLENLSTVETDDAVTVLDVARPPLSAQDHQRVAMRSPPLIVLLAPAASERHGAAPDNGASALSRAKIRTRPPQLLHVVLGAESVPLDPNLAALNGAELARALTARWPRNVQSITESPPPVIVRAAPTASFYRPIATWGAALHFHKLP